MLEGNKCYEKKAGKGSLKACVCVCVSVLSPVVSVRLIKKVTGKQKLGGGGYLKGECSQQRKQPV